MTSAEDQELIDALVQSGIAADPEALAALSAEVNRQLSELGEASGISE